jgi:hypothetical protein
MSKISERVEVLRAELEISAARAQGFANQAQTERERSIAIQGAILELQALEPPGEVESGITEEENTTNAEVE